MPLQQTTNHITSHPGANENGIVIEKRGNDEDNLNLNEDLKLIGIRNNQLDVWRETKEPTFQRLKHTFTAANVPLPSKAGKLTSSKMPTQTVSTKPVYSSLRSQILRFTPDPIKCKLYCG